MEKNASKKVKIEVEVDTTQLDEAIKKASPVTDEIIVFMFSEIICDNSAAPTASTIFATINANIFV